MQINLTYSAQNLFAWIQYRSPSGYSRDYSYSSEVASPPLPFSSYPGRGREWINRALIIVPVDSPPTAKIAWLQNKVPIFLFLPILFLIIIHYKFHDAEKFLNFSNISFIFLLLFIVIYLKSVIMRTDVLSYFSPLTTIFNFVALKP